jgi:hypothetical protein
MVNYIVSGIERSGTSMMMQILRGGGAPVAFDDSRTPNYHNPKGYYELEGGKIIRKLMDGSFSFEEYENKVIKITAYGLKFLPLRRYKIIYMKRDLDEIMDSMEKMSGSIDRKKERPLFEKLNTFSLDFMEKRDDIDYIVVNYRDVIKDPIKEIKKVNLFLDGMLNVEHAAQAVDPHLYRNVRRCR